jgi:hypothetical protein
MDFQKNNHISKGNFSFNQNYPIRVAINNTIEEDIYPENIFKNKDRIAIYNRNKINKIYFTDDFIEEDLDVPKTEFDEVPEKSDNEETENDYYSFGDDDDH